MTLGSQSAWSLLMSLLMQSSSSQTIYTQGDLPEIAGHSVLKQGRRDCMVAV